MSTTGRARGTTGATRIDLVTRVRILQAMDRWVDPLLFFMAACSIPMLIVQTGDPSEGDLALITRSSWIIWGAFTANFAVRLLVAHDRRTQFRLLSWDLILIVGQPVYTIGPRTADAVLAFMRLLVIAARSLQRGRVLRRTGRKFRNEPLRVVAFIVPFLWLTSGALIYRTETSSGVIGSFGDGLWWSAVTMATVGYGDISPKTTEGRSVAVLTMIVGIGMFSLITAKLAELLFIQRTRGNRREIVEREHTLVLGWSPKVFTIVEQLVIANTNRVNPTIVVLADRDHNDMLDDITAHVPSLASSNTAVVTRRGTPSDPTALATCRPDRARSIVVIDDTDQDASVVRTVLALMHGREDLTELSTPIVAEIDNPSTAEALRLALQGRVTIVNPTTFIARTAAQACRSAGVALAYENLLDFEGSELYLHAEAAAAGHTFGSLLGAFPHACLVGISDAAGRVDLNPAMDTIVSATDTLVLIAEDDGQITFSAPTDDIGAVPAEPPATPRPEHVVIFGWNPLCPLILRELDSFVPPGSRFTLVIDPDLSRGQEADLGTGPFTNAELTVRAARDVAYADLVEVIAEEASDHAIVLCYRDVLSVAEADARALVTTLQVRQALEAHGRDTTVVTELLDQRDVALAPPSAAGEFIVSDRLISLLLTQLAESPHLSTVFDDLLDPQGAELYAKPAARYCRPGEPTTFGAIVAAAAQHHHECAIGYRRMADSLDAATHFGTVLNPAKSQALTLTPTDQVILIADHD